MVIGKGMIPAKFRAKGGLITYIAGFTLSFLLICTILFLIARYTHKLPGSGGLDGVLGIDQEHGVGEIVPRAISGDSLSGDISELDWEDLKALQEQLAQEKQMLDQRREELFRKEREIEAEKRRLQALQTSEGGKGVMTGDSLSLDWERMKAFQNQLAQERRMLDQREKEVRRKEDEIETEKERLQALQAQIEEESERLKDKRVQRLAKMFGSMRPEQAAPIVENLDDNTLCHILMSMREREAGKILGSMAPDRAARISRKIGTLKLASGGRV